MASLALMHSSDYHFGRERAPDASQFSTTWPWKYGNPHDWLLVRGLSEAVPFVQALCKAAPLHTVSGDLTATGHEDEFLNAHTFLRSRWREKRDPESQTVGFDVRDSIQSSDPRLAVVAGNHDQWRGKGFLQNVGYTPALRSTHFRATHWKRTWSAGPIALELHGLDSNAGCPQSFSFKQRGQLDFQTGGEVDQLENDLKNPAPLPSGAAHRVRAFVIHHSLNSGGGLKRRSKRKLRTLAETHKVAAVLTGHTHDFLAKDHQTLPTNARRLWELRSASAVQGPESRVAPAPGFLAHHLFVEGAQVRWQSWRFVWDSAAKAFVLLDPYDPANAHDPRRHKPFANFLCP